MGAGITELGTTFFVGAFLVVAVWGILHVLYGVCAFPKVEREGSKSVGLLVLLSSIGLGVIAENAPDVVVNSWKVYEKLPLRLIPTDASLKVDALFERGPGDPALRTPSPLAVALARAGLFSAHGGAAGPAVEAWVLRAPGTASTPPPQLERAVRSLYFLTKNRVYLKETYAREMTRIDHRIDFSRSCTFLADVLIAFLGAALVVRLAGGGAFARRGHVLSKGRVACMAVGLSLLHVMCVAAYAEEESQFNKRAFGYYVTLPEVETAPAPSSVGRLPGISGMAHWRQRGRGFEEFVVVHDTKSHEPGPRLAVLRVVSGVPTGHASIEVDGTWPSDEPPNDLEAVCAVPGTPGEFLLLESGYWGRGRYGRIIRVALTEREGVVRVRPLGAARLPDTDDLFRDDGRGGERYAYSFEGMTAVDWNGRLLLLLAHRGGPAPEQPGRLFVAVTDSHRLGQRTEMLHLTEVGPVEAPTPAPGARPDFRHCTDLYLQMTTEHAGLLWSASAMDPGEDGPFRSAVFAIGEVDLRAADPIDVVTLRPRVAGAAGASRAARPGERWTLDGIKVEALSRTARDDAAPAIGSDDEVYGGIWRPLMPWKSGEKDQAASGSSPDGSKEPSRTRHR